jgi:hypothetical protein
MPRPDRLNQKRDLHLRVGEYRTPCSSSSQRLYTLNPNRVVTTIIFILVGLLTPQVSGAFEFRVLDVRPIAVRGGVLRLSLEVRSQNDPVPDTIPAQLPDGRMLLGYPAAIVPRPVERSRVWTEEPRGIAVQSLAGQVVRRGTQVTLFVPVPTQADGPIEIGNQHLSPTWCDRPAPDRLAANEQPSDAAGGLYAVPDPASPFAAWRRWILAVRRGSPPDTDATRGYSRIQNLAAEHETALWQVALSRLERIDAAAADAVRHLLSATCLDAGTDVAVWLTDPTQSAALLDLLLDFGKQDRIVHAEVDAWLNAQSPIIAWVAWNNQQGAELAIANPFTQSRRATVRWLQPRNREDIRAHDIELPPGVVSRVFIPRRSTENDLPGIRRATTAATPDVLEVVIGQQRYLLVADQAHEVAAPPGAFFHRLRAPLRLWELRAGTQQDLPDGVATFVHLRRLGGRWELFVEARRPSADPSPSGTAGESIVILLGQRTAQREADVILAVPEIGWHEIVAGPRDSALQVHRRSYPDRWYCRIVLPARWIEHAMVGDAPLAIGVRRRSGIDVCNDQCAPDATMPWNVAPARSLIDLTGWDTPLQLWR